MPADMNQRFAGGPSPRLIVKSFMAGAPLLHTMSRRETLAAILARKD
jgi:hypothetical protein